MTSKRSTIIDLSHSIHPATPVFPGDTSVSFEIIDHIRNPAPDNKRHLNCSRLALSIHCGTHMDAPFHFFADGKTVDDVQLDACVGPAAVVRHSALNTNCCIEPRHLEPNRFAIEQTSRVVFYTGWYRRWGQNDYFSNHPVLTGETAQWLVDRGVVLVGVDFPSVDLAPYPAHEILLARGIVIIENLTNLEAIPTNPFQLCALPLGLVGRDGSPVRAVAL